MPTGDSEPITLRGHFTEPVMDDAIAELVASEALSTAREVAMEQDRRMMEEEERIALEEAQFQERLIRTRNRFVGSMPTMATPHFGRLNDFHGVLRSASRRLGRRDGNRSAERRATLGIAIKEKDL